jgi:selenocysteine lyase/cysteine desulfurase
VASLHKWCFAPKGCGLLWAHSKHLNKIRPLVVSHNYQKSFKQEFYMQVGAHVSRTLVNWASNL